MQEFFQQANVGEEVEEGTNSGSDMEFREPEPVGSASTKKKKIPVEIGNHNILVFGDLGTGRNIRSLQASRCVDVTSFQRFQPVIYCPGWFHVRMACADAIWRRHINSGPDAEKVPAALINYVAKLRPMETRKIQANPGFRQMHEVIQHVGIVLRLEGWREEVQRRYGFSSLSEWANSEPASLLCEAQKDDSERDKVFEAMNHGDIGRLDRCLPTWMYFFMGCGKVKYARELRQYLENMYILHDSRAIRYNSLVNPTGKPDHFRAIDWVIEHNNLYIKRIFGGSGSNHTVHRMLEASPLIEVYKDVRSQFESMFCLSHKTTHHSPPKMKHTFTRLANYMIEHRVNSFIAGRDAGYKIPNTMEIGMSKLTANVEETRRAQVLKAAKQESMRAQIENQHNSSTSSLAERESEIDDRMREDTREEPDLEDDQDIFDDGTLFVDD